MPHTHRGRCNKLFTISERPAQVKDRFFCCCLDPLSLSLSPSLFLGFASLIDTSIITYLRYQFVLFRHRHFQSKQKLKTTKITRLVAKKNDQKFRDLYEKVFFFIYLLEFHLGEGGWE